MNKTLFIGQQLDQSTQPNTADTDDTGLYELYQNAVVPFVDAMIAEADLYAGDAGDSNNTVPTDQWVARTGEDATEHGAGMSYCFGCKQTIAQFNSTVVNCRAETAAQIQAREADANQTNYRGHVTVDAEGNCTVSTTGGGRWAGLYGTSREFYLSPHIAAFEAQYWSGIDCSGLVEKAVNAGRDDVQDLAISIPRVPGLTGSQGFFENNAYVYFTEQNDMNEQKLRRGDLIRVDGHVAIVHSESVLEGDYRIIHANGVTPYDDDEDGATPAIFSRKVIVTENRVIKATGCGRIKLWN